MRSSAMVCERRQETPWAIGSTSGRFTRNLGAPKLASSSRVTSWIAGETWRPQDEAYFDGWRASRLSGPPAEATRGPAEPRPCRESRPSNTGSFHLPSKIGLNDTPTRRSRSILAVYLITGPSRMASLYCSFATLACSDCVDEALMRQRPFRAIGAGGNRRGSGLPSAGGEVAVSPRLSRA